MTRESSVARQGTILIADDHEVTRQGLGHVLRLGLSAARFVEAGTFDEALEQLADTDIFLAVFDIGMPGLTSPRDLVKVRRLRPDIRVVVLSGSQERVHILAALEAGVHGYVVKSERSATLVKRIQHVLAGEIYVPPVLAKLPDEVRSGPAIEPQAPHAAALTPRQKDVLRLIGEGLSNKEIANRLQLAEGTIKMHVAAILRTIGASNRAHAAVIGKQFLL